ncbi:MAG: recombinase family protein [Bdellovibrio sp.]|nr:recombinase family protein [Bdellovibrio sp.]
MSKIKRTGIYGRISVASDVEHDSREQQLHIGKAALKQLSIRKGVSYLPTHILVEENGISGGSTKRPKFQEMCSLIVANKLDAVWAKEVSRISRNLGDFCDFIKLCEQYGVEVYINNLDLEFHTPMGRMMLQLLATFAEFERELGRQRTSESVVSAMLNHGKINGGYTPLGFELDPEHPGFPKPKPEDLKKVTLLMQTFVETGSLEQTLIKATEQNIHNTTGKKFGYTTLRRLLTNPRYIGKLPIPTKSKNEQPRIVDLKYGAVVDRNLFDAVQAALREHDIHNGRHNRKAKSVNYLLTGLLFHEDGASYSGTSGKDNARFRYYRSKNHYTLDATALEKGLIQDLRSLHTNKDKFTNWMEQSHLKLKSLANSKNQELENVRSSLKTLETDNQKLLNRYMTSEGAALQSWMNEQISTLNERKLQLEKFEQQLLEDISIFEKSKFDNTAISKRFSLNDRGSQGIC